MSEKDEVQAEVNRLQVLSRLEQLERFYALEMMEGWTQEQAIEYKAVRAVLQQNNTSTSTEIPKS